MQDTDCCILFIMPNVSTDIQPRWTINRFFENYMYVRKPYPVTEVLLLQYCKPSPHSHWIPANFKYPNTVAIP